MHHTIYTFLAFGWVLFCFPNQLFSQAEDLRMSEKEIKVEDRFVKAKLLIFSDKKDDAIKLLDSIRREAPEKAMVYFELAKLYFDKKDFNQAESNLKSALKLDGSNDYFKAFEIELLDKAGRSDEAIALLKTQLNIQNKRNELYDKLVALQVKKQDTDGAIKTLQTKEKNLGWSTQNSLKIAELYETSGNLPQALTTLEQITSKYPNDTKYLKLIISMLHANDKVMDTEPYFHRILAIQPNDQDAKLGLILINNKKGNAEDKLVTLQPLVSNPDAPLDMKIKELLPYLVKQSESEDTILSKQLIYLGDKLTLAHPNEAKAHALYGDVLKNSGNTLAATRQYEKTLTLNKNIFSVWEQLMFCLTDLKDYKRLDEVSSEAIDFFPNNAISYCFGAKAAFENGNAKKANSLLDDAELISGGNADILSRIYVIKAETMIKNKDYQGATEWIQKSLEISKEKNGDAWELKGDIAMATQDIKNAKTYWEKSLQNNGNIQRIKSKLNGIKGQ